MKYCPAISPFKIWNKISAIIIAAEKVLELLCAWSAVHDLVTWAMFRELCNLARFKTYKIFRVLMWLLEYKIYPWGKTISLKTILNHNPIPKICLESLAFPYIISAECSGYFPYPLRSLLHDATKFTLIRWRKISLLHDSNVSV